VKPRGGGIFALGTRMAVNRAHPKARQGPTLCRPVPAPAPGICACLNRHSSGCPTTVVHRGRDIGTGKLDRLPGPEPPKKQKTRRTLRTGASMSRRGGWGLGERDTCPIHYSSRVRVQCGYMTRRIKPGSLRVHFPRPAQADPPLFSCCFSPRSPDWIR
jgi:hypothetical protein